MSVNCGKMGIFQIVFLTVFLYLSPTTARKSKQDQDMQKVGFAQFIVIENIINLGGSSCSTARNITVRRAKDEAISCLGKANITSSYCHFLTHDFMRCVDPLIAKVEDCNREPILKGLIEASVQATLFQAAFVCNIDGAQIFELLNPCLLRALELKEPCVNTFMMDIQSVTRTNKSLFEVTCQAASTMKNCLSSTIDSECPNNITRTSIKGMYDASVKPCNFEKKDSNQV